MSIQSPSVPEEGRPDPAVLPAGAQPRLIGRPLIQMNVHLTPALWRIGPAWAALAGVFAAQPSNWDTAFVLRLLAVVLLADPIWGAFWGILRAGRPADAPETGVAPAAGPLPYTQPGSPAARAWRWINWQGPDSATGGAAVQGWPVALLLSVLLAFLLGRAAFVLTAAVILLSLLGLFWGRHGRSAPASLEALLIVAAPWLLGQAVAGGGDTASFLLAAALTFMAWGVLRLEQGVETHPRVLLAGQIALIALQIALRAPLAAGLSTALFLAPWWYLSQPGERERLALVHPWLLAAMMLAAGVRV